MPKTGPTWISGEPRHYCRLHHAIVNHRIIYENAAKMTIFLVLPAYNEEANLPALFESCEKQVWRSPTDFPLPGIPLTDFRIILVNDGSSDATDRVVQAWQARLPIEMISHPQNRGLGETSNSLNPLPSCLGTDRVAAERSQSSPPTRYTASHFLLPAGSFSRRSQLSNLPPVRSPFSLKSFWQMWAGEIALRVGSGVALMLSNGRRFHATKTPAEKKRSAAAKRSLGNEPGQSGRAAAAGVS